MRVTKSTIGVILSTLLAMLIVFAGPAQANKIRIALAETPSDELAAFFVALDRAQKNGLDYEWTAFSDEELAIQAILSGQMDIGFGTPYSVMQRSKGSSPNHLSIVQAKVLPCHLQKIFKTRRSEW